MFRRLAVAGLSGGPGVRASSLSGDSFTAPTTVVAPPCATHGTADAAFGGGTVRGFAGFGACHRATYYFQGGTQGYTRVLSPYRTSPFAAASHARS